MTTQHTVGYVRVSTGQQAEHGASIAAQTAAIEAYCATHGMRLTRIVVDAGVSASTPLAERQGGSQLRDCRKIVATKLDRLFRSAIDALTTVDRWSAAGVALHVVDMGGASVDTSSPVGRFTFTVLVATAELDMAQAAERTRLVKQHQCAEGRYLGGAVPYGHQVVDGMLVADEAEQAVIRRMMEWRRDERSWRWVASRLTAEGHVTRTGKSWAAASVRRIVLAASSEDA